METMIVVCLIIIIILLLKDKVVIRKVVRKDEKRENTRPDLPDIMGRPKTAERNGLPMNATKSQTEESAKMDDNFATETYGENIGWKNPQDQGEPDDDSGNISGFENGEDEWDDDGFQGMDNEFATGVTFEELTTVGALLDQEIIDPALQQKAVDIVQRLQGTELLSLLENSMEGASRKIAKLLDKSLATGTDSSSPVLRKIDLENFDIGEFV
ncbi:conjugal transfer protein TraD [Proteiniphilum saccharofermentans]|uniref:conjugal transfer protein TraD n=1 Tax=Proteiniphilum saccharofermentans TaxID=1642647 RepID=UPI0028AB741F|nr:conjugal transfer protein TraD [Proteiniphilum saccharofermentans]